MPVSPTERQLLLSQVNNLAQQQLDNLWSAAERLADIDFAAYIIGAFPELVDPFALAAAELAATWFEESDPASKYVAVTAATTPAGQLTKSAQWALGGDGPQGLARLSGTAQRAVFNGARDTTILNAEATGAKWVRVARPAACEFCRLLSSRQEVYASKQSAKFAVGRYGRPRGSRKIGDKYHDDCFCQPVEIRSNQSIGDVLDAETIERFQQWDDLYQKAVANAGSGEIHKVLSAWRQLGADTAQ